MWRTKVVAVLALALLASFVSVGLAWGKPQEPREIRKSAELREAVETAGILVHERRFQRIANNNDDTRASGTPGYDASANYVAGKLRTAGYDVTVQPFEFPFFQELEPSTFSRTDVEPDQAYENGTDFATMEYSGSGNVVDKQVVPTNGVTVPPTAPAGETNSGCDVSDFPASTSGNVALIQRGTCTFGEKAQNAQAAGAVAAIIFNEGQEGRTDVVQGTLGGPGVTIPVIGTTYAVGEELFGAVGKNTPRASITTDTLSETRETTNVIADTDAGRADRTVVVGAHLDSVIEGPGINDNGSGTSAILEIALQMSELNVKPRNQVRFAFWGAEESGLLGSEYYVANLPEDELDDIALNLNFDMLGSPNFVRFVYDGDGSDTPTAGPAGSAEIEETFNGYFAAKNLETEPTAFDGRSDYGPFIEVGIPAGGLFSGAEGIKTPEQEDVYGGTAGEAYDPCYHQACDDITNLSLRGLGQLSDGAAHATYTYATARSVFEDDERNLNAQRSIDVYDEFKGPKAIK